MSCPGGRLASGLFPRPPPPPLFQPLDASRVSFPFSPSVCPVCRSQGRVSVRLVSPAQRDPPPCLSPPSDSRWRCVWAKDRSPPQRLAQARLMLTGLNGCAARRPGTGGLTRSGSTRLPGAWPCFLAVMGAKRGYSPAPLQASLAPSAVLASRMRRAKGPGCSPPPLPRACGNRGSAASQALRFLGGTSAALLVWLVRAHSPT